MNHFHFTFADVTTLYLVLGVVACLPPVLCAALSAFVSDRTPIVSSLTVTVGGVILLFAPPLRLWPLVAVGFAMVIMASILFTPAVVGLFTNLLGPSPAAAVLPLILSIAQVGHVIGIVVGDALLRRLPGSPLYLVAAAPAFVAWCGVASPWVMRRLRTLTPASPVVPPTPQGRTIFPRVLPVTRGEQVEREEGAATDGQRLVMGEECDDDDEVHAALGDGSSSLWAQGF